MFSFTGYIKLDTIIAQQPPILKAHHTADIKQPKLFLKLFTAPPWDDILLTVVTINVNTKSPMQAEPHDTPEAASDIIRLHNVNKTYKRGGQVVNALTDVSLTIRKGEFVAITGASGSGKSTLLQLIGGLDKPTSGAIVVNGTDLKTLSDRKLSRFRNTTVGFVFQSFYLQPFLKLGTNIEVPGMFAGRKRRERKSQVDTLIKQVGLSDRVNHYPKELSGGQAQRAAIARALLNNPAVLLADEPTGNLDSTNSQEIIKLFHTIRDTLGTTVIIVTHNPEIADGADRQIALQDGVIV